MATITVPDFDFTGHYYADILEDILAWWRANVPEINNESPYEVHTQALRAFSLVGHLVNTNLDTVAQEMLFRTAQLPDSLRSHLALIGYTVIGDVPAVAVIEAILSQTFSTAPVTVIPDNSKFATSSAAGGIVYEADAAVTTTLRTDRVGYVYAEDGGVFTDHTANAQLAGAPFTAWATPAVGDSLYIGHPDVLWNKITVTGVSVAAAGMTGVWEAYIGSLDELAADSNMSKTPNAVAVSGGGLKVRCDALFRLATPSGTSLIGGITVRVKLNETDAYEDRPLQWAAPDGNFITTTGYLGQSTPSTTAADYSVMTSWYTYPLDGVNDAVIEDGTREDALVTANGLQKAGKVTLARPIGLIPASGDSTYWLPGKGEVNSAEAHWVRWRLIAVAGPVSPQVDTININDGEQYVLLDSTQGTTVSAEVLGSSSGAASQTFALVRSPVIFNSATVEVDSGSGFESWGIVEHFLNSTSTDKTCRVVIDSDGAGSVAFGDGVNGKIPPAGVNNIRSTYRIDASSDGNVGADQITINRSGIGYAKKVRNPRPASGWSQAEDATEEGRELLKFKGPADLRALGRAVHPTDVEYLTTRFVASTGAKPWTRAKAFEEGYGVKTLKNVVVGAGGSATSATLRAELDAYFNGDVATGAAGVLVANQQVTTVDYAPKIIDITATIEGGDADVIEEFMNGIFQAEARSSSDSTKWVWAFGGAVPRSLIFALLHQADPDVRNVIALAVPAADVLLNDDELPVIGAITLTVTA